MSAGEHPPPPRALGGPRHGRRATSRPSLLRLLFTTNAVVLMLAVVALALTPATVSTPVSIGEAVVLAAGLAGVLALNLLLMRRALLPLGRLWSAMRTVQPLRPGQRVDPGGRSVEVEELAIAFNDMLDRLEAERRDSARRLHAAQEEERRWLALELHDEIGQTMTALLLQLEVLSRQATPEQAPVVTAALDAARQSLDRVRHVVRRLRPEALDDLGLASALVRLCHGMSSGSEASVRWEISRGIPELSQDAELVVYRVAQESLTNAIRHAGAGDLVLRLEPLGGGVRLSVADDGRGMAGVSREGSGIRGMRERALTIGATLRIHAGGTGTRVVLDVPAAEARP